MAVVTSTDRPKSVRNRCVIEVFGGDFVLSRWFLDFSVGVGAFVIGPSHISSFFSPTFNKSKLKLAIYDLGISLNTDDRVCDPPPSPWLRIMTLTYSFAIVQGHSWTPLKP